MKNHRRFQRHKILRTGRSLMQYSGRDPITEPACKTCKSMWKGEIDRGKGWCNHEANRTPPDPGWKLGFTPAVDDTGWCQNYEKLQSVPT